MRKIRSATFVRVLFILRCTNKNIFYMAEISSMKGRTLFITGASRGIGRAIALK